MMTPDTQETSVQQPEPRDYEAPQVERVLSAADLDREILYAGFIASGEPG